MRKLLLFLTLFCVSVGTWAGTIANDNGWLKLDDLQPGDLATALEDVSVWTSGTAGDLATATKVSFGSNVSLNDADLAALKTLIPAATHLKMDQASIEEDADISNLETTAVEYLQLPDGMTKESDVTKMSTLNSKNTALKMVGAYDGSNTVLPELALYSFAANEVSNFSNQMMNVANLAMVARLAGTYGDKDLMNNGPVFGYTPPCIWDFTGATFTACTVNTGIDVEYYAYNDPFCEGGTSKPGNNYQTNAFFYFGGNEYSKKVVDIKLPTGMTELPPRSLYYLGANNIENARHKAAYKAYYDLTDAEVVANSVTTNSAVIPDLIIPDNYTKIDYECGVASSVQHLVVGSGMKIIEGGAFSACIYLEDLDFGAGLSNCYLGDHAFAGDAQSKMKHIALSEGIVSLGNYCFQNAQHLESIRLPQTLINIGNAAFDNCLALNSITIPENVDKIGMDAFRLCPFTDIYLTTTDPEKIPIVFTGGNSFNGWGAGASFHHGHYDGWEALSGIHPGNEPDGMTWDEAVEWYYVHANGLPVLHYPKELAGKVRADISANYHSHSSDTPSLGLPTSQDMHARETAGGANVGTAGSGIYTRDGWAQFMLMKEYTTDPGGDVYTKKYEDVWYTMCFPFDLTDEQLAAAFNETFNIVDFSGVEVKEADDEAGTSKKLILHFNKVAKTYYRDNEGNEYEVIGREVDPESKFEYNIYEKDGVTYHHSTVSSQLSSNKTKTFAPGNSIDESNANKDQAIIIDGVLATAGHPYMIHPAIGTSIGNPKRCDFSGVSWKPMTQWASIFEAQKRVVDLGVAKGTINEEDFKQSTPDADNYTQAAYSKYTGQTYTFIGNAKEYRDDAQTGDDPLEDEPQIPEKPIKPVKPSLEEVEALKPSGTEPTTAVQNPETNSKYSDDFKDLFKTVHCTFSGWDNTVGGNVTIDYTFGEDIPNTNLDEYYADNSWRTKAPYHNWIDADNTKIAAYLGTPPTSSDYDALKQLTIDYQNDQSAYAEYRLWEIYYEKKSEYDAWDQAAVDAQYNTEKAAYDAAVAAHDAWAEKAKKWLTYIPKNAYFLGRRGTALPKYYREVADDPEDGKPSTRTGGVWTQFTAIVIPNDAAVAGIESELDGKTASSKGFDMAFDEGFLGEIIEQDDVVTLIEKAQEEGAKVEYMDIVVSINGEVVRRGTTSIEGLPKGIYIVNGKKYFVK